MKYTKTGKLQKSGIQKNKKKNKKKHNLVQPSPYSMNDY